MRFGKRRPRQNGGFLGCAFLYRFKQRVVKRAKPIASAKRRAAAGSILHMAKSEAKSARSVSVLWTSYTYGLRPDHARAGGGGGALIGELLFNAIVAVLEDFGPDAQANTRHAGREAYDDR